MGRSPVQQPPVHSHFRILLRPPTELLGQQSPILLELDRQRRDLRSPARTATSSAPRRAASPKARSMAAWLVALGSTPISTGPDDGPSPRGMTATGEYPWDETYRATDPVSTSGHRPDPGLPTTVISADRLASTSAVRGSPSWKTPVIRSSGNRRRIRWVIVSTSPRVSSRPEPSLSSRRPPREPRRDTGEPPTGDAVGVPPARLGGGPQRGGRRLEGTVDADHDRRRHRAGH